MEDSLRSTFEPAPIAEAPAPKRRARKPLVEVRRSRIQGRGVFALVDIPVGKRILEYTGERLTCEQADERYFDDDQKSRHHTFLFALGDDYVIDARRVGSDARYINHSCAPNCEAIIERNRIFIYAKKAIPAGTELTYDYWYTTDASYTVAELRRIYPCKCGTAKCRGTLAAVKKPAKRAAAKKAQSKAKKARPAAG